MRRCMFGLKDAYVIRLLCIPRFYTSSEEHFVQISQCAGQHDLSCTRYYCKMWTFSAGICLMLVNKILRSSALRFIFECFALSKHVQHAWIVSMFVCFSIFYYSAPRARLKVTESSSDRNALKDAGSLLRTVWGMCLAISPPGQTARLNWVCNILANKGIHMLILCTCLQLCLRLW